jgi:hypothetical protein
MIAVAREIGPIARLVDSEWENATCSVMCSVPKDGIRSGDNDNGRVTAAAHSLARHPHALYQAFKRCM